MSGHDVPRIVTDALQSRLTVIEASAGTGKTFTLEHLVSALVVDDDIALSSIAVVTFTEKATHELKARLRARLLGLRDRLTPTSPEGARVARALREFDDASIFTMHGFCRRLLGDHAFDSGRRQAEELVRGQDVWRDAFDAVFREELPNDPRDGALFTAILAEIRDFEDLAEKLALLRDRSAVASPTWAPAVVFEHARRFAQACAPMLEVAQAAPIHANSRRAIVSFVESLNALTQVHSLTTPIDALKLGWSIRREFGKDPAALTKLVELGDARVLEFVEALGVLREETPSAVALAAHLAFDRVQRRMRAQKRARGQLDFHDMLVEVAAALDGEHAQSLLFALRQRYRVALIDEFQDTDRLQWKIFRRVFFESEAHRLIVVGDPKQAIYGFRGADVQTYRDACDEMFAAGGKRLDLDENYRSSECMVSAYNTLLVDASGSLFSGANTYPHPVRATPSNARFFDGSQAESAACVVLRVDKADGADDARRQASQAIAAEISRLLSPSANMTFAARDGERRAVRPEDIFVLCYTRAEERQIGRSLRQIGVPFAFYKQEGLFQSDEADDIDAVLEAVAHPSSASRMRALATPIFGVPLEHLERASALGALHPSYATLVRLSAHAERRDWLEFFRGLLDETGVSERALVLGDERAFTNYHHLAELLEAHARSSFATPLELLFALRGFRAATRPFPGDDANVQRLERDVAAVQIMTVHKAKGLEAPIVFVYGGLGSANTGQTIFRLPSGERAAWFGAGAPPHVAQSAKREAREEQERLAYVAITRPRVRLYLPSYPIRTTKNRELVTGAYACVAERLRQLEPSSDGALFDWQPAQRERVARTDRAMIDRAALSSLASNAPERRSVDVLRALRKPPVFSSYSRIARRLKIHEREIDSDDRVFELVEAAAKIRVESALAPGIASGLFLHALLEKCDLNDVRSAADDSALWQQPSFQNLVRSEALRYGVNDAGMRESAVLVHRALRSSWRFGDVPLEGLVTATRFLRETEFLYPIPERTHPVLGAHATHKSFAAERGYVRGFIDAVFEHEGRGYVLDWKSDALGDFEHATLRAHVASHYDIQAKLYGFALARMLNVHDEASYEALFGGIVYVFLRGQHDAATAMTFSRPSWSQMQLWERELVDFSEWS